MASIGRHLNTNLQCVEGGGLETLLIKMSTFVTVKGLAVNVLKPRLIDINVKIRFDVGVHFSHEGFPYLAVRVRMLSTPDTRLLAEYMY